jgi:type VI secretion system protein ImpM
MEVGLYGKLPSHGDFLRRRIADEIVTRWDGWLQSAIAASRRILGERWLEIYLTSPAWRFSCEKEVCGPNAMAGVIVPSVDRVGRYFPLTLMWQIPEELVPLSVAMLCNSWFEAAERHVIETLSQSEVQFEEFDARVVALGEQLEALCATQRVMLDPHDAQTVSDTRATWQIPLGDPSRLSEVFSQLLHHRLRVSCAPLMLWWTEGSAMVAPCALLTPGLPPDEHFAAFLGGSWSECGWRTVGAKVRSEAFIDTLVPEAAVEFHSAGLSDQGRVRESNQDAFLERPEIGLWAVADGMGGYAGGDVASRMVCDALADLSPADTLQNMVERVRERLAEVNDQLRSAAQRAAGHPRSGSTVAVLLTRNAQCSILWAGDSRVYRMRGEALEQLTRDHSYALEVADGTMAADTEEMSVDFSITRAVGGEETLELELRRDHVRKGDRFLLCSDGLTHELDDAHIEGCLRGGDAGESARQVLEAALEAGGHDNVTVIVVDAM